MATIEELRRLKSAPLFKDLAPAELELAVEAARRRKAAAGEFLYQQGDPAATFYLLLEGRIRMLQVTPEGQQVILRYATPGEAFGVIAALSEAEYPASAEVVENSAALAWDQTAMRRLMHESPAIALNALRILAGRVREFQDRVRELSTEKVERRIARALLRLARQAGRKTPEGVLIDLPLSRQDLAEMSGTTQYTVSRTLSQWEAQGLVQSGRSRVVIRNPHGLVTIAEDLPAGPGEQGE